MTQFNNQQVNISTGRAYQGANLETLNQNSQAKGFTSNEWGTMKQWNRLRETIRVNEKGTKITFKGKSGEEHAYLFNRCQLVDAA